MAPSESALRHRGELALLLCAFLWSTGGLFIKLVDAHPLVIAGGRSLLAILVILALQRGKFAFTARHFWAGLAYALTMISFVAANKLTTSANAILIQYAAPVYVAFMAAIFLKEKVRRRDVLALSGVLGGLVLFFAEKVSAGGFAGNIIALGSGLGFAIFFVLMRSLKDGSTIEAMLIAHGITALFSLPFWGDFVPSQSNLLGLGALGVFQIGLSTVLFARGIKTVPALAAILITTLEPVLNPLWVFLATGETPTLSALGGGALILVSVLVLQILDGIKAKNSRSNHS